MIAVIDSNILYGDPRLAKSEARILLEHHRRGSYVLAIPEVVVRELAKNFAKVLDERSNAIVAAATKLSELGHDPSAAVVRDIGAARDEYLVWLRATSTAVT